MVAGLLVTVAWQYPFLLYGLSLPVDGLVYRHFDEPSGRTPKIDGDGVRRYGRDLFALASRPPVLATLVALTVPSFLYTVFLTYNSFLVVRILDGSAGQAGVLVAVLTSATGLSASQAGRLIERFGRPLPLLGANLCLGVGLSIFALAPSLLVAAGGGVLTGIGSGMAFSLLRSSITGLAPEQLRGGLVGLGESVNKLSNSLAPVLTGAAIAWFQPTIGFLQSVRWTVLASGILLGSVGVLAVIVVLATTDSTRIPTSAD